MAAMVTSNIALNMAAGVESATAPSAARASSLIGVVATTSSNVALGRAVGVGSNVALNKTMG
eukprot:7652218-Alexandrium_andersonii.AAC.1